MARLPRVVIAEVPHHVTQRGNARRFILDCDADRNVYIELLREDIQRCSVTFLGYCLMSNHVHLVLVPLKADGLAEALKHTHGRYASYWNAVHRSSGHLWQGRFYSCPLGPAHLWQTLRYTELNPVRAGLVKDAASWPWSSAAVHLGQTAADPSLRTMARPLVCFELACLPRGRRNPVRAGRNSSLHLHRSPPGHGRVRQTNGEEHPKTPGSTKRRPHSNPR